MPVWNWWKIHEEQDYTSLLINGKKLNKHAVTALRKLKKEFHETFGIHPQYELYIFKLIDLEVAKNKVACGDKSEKIFVSIIEDEIEQMKLQSQDEKGHFVAPMEKHFGFPIDPKTTSTFKFYDRVRAIEKEIEQMQKQAS